MPYNMFLSLQQRVQSLLKSSSDVYSKVNQIFLFQRADVSSVQEIEGCVQDFMAFDKTCKSYCFPLDCRKCFDQEGLHTARYYTVCDKDCLHSC
jgi:hypothetical protein